MENILYITMLYDFYGELLTEKQRLAIENHYLCDMSLSEVGKLCGTSKQAVGELLKRTVAILEDYESKLNLYEKYKKQSKIAEEVVAKLNKAFENGVFNAEEFESIKNDILSITD